MSTEDAVGRHVGQRRRLHGGALPFVTSGINELLLSPGLVSARRNGVVGILTVRRGPSERATRSLRVSGRDILPCRIPHPLQRTPLAWPVWADQRRSVGATLGYVGPTITPLPAERVELDTEGARVMRNRRVVPRDVQLATSNPVPSSAVRTDRAIPAVPSRTIALIVTRTRERGVSLPTAHRHGECHDGRP